MKLKVISHSADGMLNVLIDGKEYLYLLDSAYIQVFLAKIKRSEGAALNYLKEKARDCIEMNDRVKSISAN